jgi:hypothetical protein
MAGLQKMQFMSFIRMRVRERRDTGNLLFTAHAVFISIAGGPVHKDAS